MRIVLSCIIFVDGDRRGGTVYAAGDVCRRRCSQDDPRTAGRCADGHRTCREHGAHPSQSHPSHRTTERHRSRHRVGGSSHHRGATIVTGGRVVRSVDSNGENVAKIIDGEARQVGPGDVVVIPAGTPHWYSQIDRLVTYLEVRYDPGTNE